MNPIKSFLDDRDKSLNPAHVVALILTIASVIWVSFLVLKNHTMPDLSGIAYLLGGSGAMNIAHKAEDIIAKFKKSPDPITPADEPASSHPRDL